MTTDKKVYVFSWVMRGTKRIYAETVEQAQRRFETLTEMELAEDGELDDVPEPTVETRDDE